jgi:iron-regulated transporter 1
MSITPAPTDHDIELTRSIPTSSPPKPPPPPLLDRRALLSLLLQHLSSTWGVRSTEFATYLFFSTLFGPTLLPSSLYGFFVTGFAILGAGFVGKWVDQKERLKLVRWCIVGQKVLAAVQYAVFLVLFLRLRKEAGEEKKAAVVWALFTVVTICGMLLGLTTVGLFFLYWFFLFFLFC